MSTNFPTSLDSYASIVDGTTILEAAHHNNVADAIEALEAKVGVDSSSVAGSLDYKVSNNFAFGAWTTKSKDTNYQAATDGFVMAYASALNTTIEIKTDGSNPPTTVRAKAGAASGVFAMMFAICPVRKGDYYRVEDTSGTIAAIYWLPFGM